MEMLLRCNCSPGPSSFRPSPWQRSLGLLLSSTWLIVLPGCQSITERLTLVPRPTSPDIKRLAQATTMTPLARRIFYRQTPTIEPREVFLEQCSLKHPEDTIILGCYLSEVQGSRVVGGKIVIKAIDDPRFAGTMEVTAAHEMLHAAYDQLDKAEQNQLFKQLELALEQVTDQRLLKILTDYKAAGDLDHYRHELHAHLGTELKTLDNPELEAHYQRYFRDRQRVLQFARQSAQVVTQFDQQAETLASEIEWLESKLQKSQQLLEDPAADLNEANLALVNRRAELTLLRSQAEAAIQNNDIQAEQLVKQFEREQLAFNAEVEAYNIQLQHQKHRIEQFNQRLENYRQKVDRYNQLAQDTRDILEGLEGITLAPEEAVLP